VNDSTSPHPTKDAKRAKFEKLAVARTKRVIKGIRILANLGGRGRYNYEFAEADVEKIYATLNEEVEQLRIKMIAPGRQLDIEFDL
jgi:hypothetical protein